MFKVLLSRQESSDSFLEKVYCLLYVVSPPLTDLIDPNYMYYILGVWYC